jgi:hypothetical protein
MPSYNKSNPIWAAVVIYALLLYAVLDEGGVYAQSLQPNVADSPSSAEKPDTKPEQPEEETPAIDSPQTSSVQKTVDVEAQSAAEQERQSAISAAAEPGDKLPPTTPPLESPAPPLFKPGFLLQTWGLVEDVPRGDELDTRATFFIRRARFMLSGQLCDKVNYFVETDLPNFGKYANYTVDLFIQDAWVELNFDSAIQLDIGMLLIPFSHHAMQGATSLHALDYHSTLVRYPTGGDKVWRDMGLMVRGLLFNDRLEYRVAVSNGIHHPAANTSERSREEDDGSTFSWKEPTDPRNPKDWPRVTARLTLNAFEPEGGATVSGFFYDGLYLKDTPEGIISPKKVLAVGGSVDWQKGLNVIWDDVPASAGSMREVAEIKDYFAAAGDVFWDLPLSADRLLATSGQINFYYYNHGDRSDALAYYSSSANAANYSGIGIASELGIRYDAVEPIVCLDWYNSNKVPDGYDDLGDYLALYGGINYFWMAHSLTFKLQAGAQKTGRYSVDRSEIVYKFAPFGTVQAQLLL